MVTLMELSHGHKLEYIVYKYFAGEWDVKCFEKKKEALKYAKIGKRK